MSKIVIGLNLSNVNSFAEVIQMWKCCKCHEQNEETFSFCWSCGTSNDGIEDKSFQGVDEIAPSSIKGQPVLVTSIGLAEYPDQQEIELLACVKCGSENIIPNVRIVTHTEEFKKDLQVEIYENPKALIFKGTHTGTLTAYICGQCGYTEMYISNPQYLLNQYRKNKKN
ncbi:hypothetical protein [Nostoc commune]|nr:hypothetical protein [Nostoc commune]